MQWEPYGPNAFLVRFGDQLGPSVFELGRAIVAELEQRPPPGLLEFVPAFTTVLLEFEPAPATDLAKIAEEFVLRIGAAAGRPLPPAPIKEIPVIYDGPDLQRVADGHGLTIAEVCALHAEPVYQVYLLGFSPGFPYLGDLNPRLHTPRLPTPRTRVPAGSVAIGGQHTGIYSVDSPGGWNIIGRTHLKIFDPARAEQLGEDTSMFYLHPGDRVKFCPYSAEPPHPGAANHGNARV